MEIIKFNQVVKKYKTFSLKEVSFKVEKGTIVGFIGENGAGKTTCLKALAGIINFDEGEIFLFETNIKDITSAQREDVSFIIDETNFPEHFRISQVGVILKNLYKNWSPKLFNEYLIKYGLDKKKKIKELSKGMKAKLNIAIALSHNAKVLVLDEPTNGLDPVVRDEFLDLLLDYKENEGGTVLISSHLINDLEKICDEVVFIHNGDIIFDDTKENILKSYKYYVIPKTELERFDQSIIVKSKISGSKVEILATTEKYDEFKEYEDDVTLENIMIQIVRGKK